jgi:hypothetical protein
MKTTKTGSKTPRHERATFTLPPDVIDHLEQNWRQHKNMDGSLCANKSNYIADLIRRNARIKR